MNRRTAKEKAFYEASERVSALQSAESLNEISEKMTSLRDQFAVAALNGTYAAQIAMTFEQRAERAYKMADAMLEARKL